MADAELDDVERLMPRTKAANERVEVDLDRLKEYMDITKQDQSLVMSQRTSVMIRSDVRKDADGFEDIDDFWADDDMGGEKDDTEGEESSFLSEGATSSANQSMVSTTSEREVNLSGLEAVSSDNDDSDDNNDANMDVDVDMDADTNAHANSEPRGQHNLSSDTMELESQPSQRGDSLGEDQVDVADGADTTATATSKSKSPRATMTPMKKKTKLSSRPSSYASDEEHKSSDQSAPSPSSPPFNRSMDADVSFGQDNARTPSSSAKKQLAGLATPAKSKANQRTNSRSTSPALSSGSKAAQKKKLKLRRESREFSFGEPGGDGGFGGDVSSPFSIQDGVLTPLSNASEKNLPSIKPFSSAASDSPNIRVQLFKKKSNSATDESDDDDHAWDGDNITKRAKKPKVSKKKEELATTPTHKPTRKAKYKSTPASDMDEDELTDKDDGSFTANNTSGMASDDNDSDWDNEKGNKSVDVSRVRSVRDGDLSYADEVLRDSQGNALDGEGLRRSKRQRYKPLAWYKGEHYVYERRQSGVGLVIPTVLGIERAGSTTPMKKNRPTTTTKRGTSTRPRNTKPLSRDKLPKGLKIDDGEWADLWDITADAMNKMNVICRADEIEHRELPSVDDLPAGFAGQSFNLRNPTPFSRWICGRLNLPPGAAKEAESVGDAVQVFFVMGCQPQSLEVAFGPAQDGYFDPKNATRFLLNPSDELYIPAQNAYYLKNHSETATSELHFMILKGGDATAAAAGSAGARSSRGQEEQKEDEEEEEPVTPREENPTKQRKRKRTKA